jgi:hypothetical protein
MKNLSEIDWDTLIEYIRSGQAALFIGPEVMLLEGQPIQHVWRQRIFEKFKSRIAYHYEPEGLFLFSNKIAKNDAAQLLRKSANEQQPDEAVFQKIAQIKFPVVVSINPDTYLSDIAYKYGVRHRFSHFKSRSKGTEDVEEPHVDLPLFYNLCGSVNDDESVILDYEDLFRLISSSVSAPGLPIKLKEVLDRVRIFFFVGFQFEKWYTQLLLRLLCGQEESMKYAANQQQVSDETRDFLFHQFQVEFLEKDQAFLDVLHQKCNENGLLRPLSDPASADEINLIRLIQTGKDLHAPLELLRQKTEKTPSFKDTTQLMGQYNNLMEEKRKGTLDSRDYFVQYNKIIDGILQLIREAAI